MKSYSYQLFMSIILAVTLLSCKEDEPKPVIETIPDAETNVLLLEGSFQSEVHATSGSVKFFEATSGNLLSLEDFKTDNGPDLYVYISKDKSVSNSVNLGKLKSTSGTFNYAIDASISLEDYPYVLIWCRDFAVLFGSAKAIMP